MIRGGGRRHGIVRLRVLCKAIWRRGHAGLS